MNEVSSQFAQKQRKSVDALELGREKNLLGDAMLSKTPNELKMQIATVISESHKINATTSEESDKLDYATTKYS